MTVQNTSLQHGGEALPGSRVGARPAPASRDNTDPGKGRDEGSWGCKWGQVCVTVADKGLGREQPVKKWLLTILGDVLHAQYL